MPPKSDEKLRERSIKEILARLNSIETRLNFCNENLTILSTTTGRNFLDVNQALRSINFYGSRDTVLVVEQREEIRRLRFRIAELERKQDTQARAKQILIRYTREFRTSITKLTRSFYRLNNRVELDNPNLTLVDGDGPITTSNLRIIDKNIARLWQLNVIGASGTTFT